MNIFRGIQARLPSGSSGSTTPNSNGSGADDRPPEGSDPDDTSLLDEKQGSIVLSLISQLRIGMDLSKIAFPTFVLEPRSMLERITDFMTHTEILFGLENESDKAVRFERVLQYYMLGWHIRPKGVKKPYNPTIGEIFRCRYTYTNGTEGFYVAEQVSHHPPVSAYFFLSPANKILVVGELRPKSRFLGNSVQTIMDGENRITLLGTDDGEYIISLPNMFARGILFGKLVFELGDTIDAINEKTGMSGSVEFKTKGFFSGTYNVVKGQVQQDRETIGEISGKWSHHLEYKDLKFGKTRVWFDDATTTSEELSRPTCHPEEHQEPNESRRLWSGVTRGIRAGDQNAAQEAKTIVEDNGRKYARTLDEQGATHNSRFFEFRGGKWHAKFVLPENLEEAKSKVQEWIWADTPVKKAT
ncbi:Oxysterol-binding protein [Dacryopinax primogenitus]|uniref:Oxysterol-binding protein n=1 Tax=Dacryopinax primogenitus (strain DJM 731) TaxID=1858805 RepID=M5FZV6_DACPD|nr:Oxysterol-binding protein [Dacryopinax primogenitus]EJT99091.1 Oxysterol-binding protein [Dacryopinax primogenitus]